MNVRQLILRALAAAVVFVFAACQNGQLAKIQLYSDDYPDINVKQVLTAQPEPNDYCKQLEQREWVNDLLKEGGYKESIRSRLEAAKMSAVRLAAESLTDYLLRSELPPDCLVAKQYVVSDSTAAHELGWRMSFSHPADVAYQISRLKKENHELYKDSRVAGVSTLAKAVQLFANEFGSKLKQTWLGKDKGQWGEAARVLYDLMEDWNMQVPLSEDQRTKLYQLASSADYSP